MTKEEIKKALIIKEYRKKVILFIELLLYFNLYAFIFWLSVNGAIEIYFNLFK